VKRGGFLAQYGKSYPAAAAGGAKQLPEGGKTSPEKKEKESSDSD
jgi:hypothetical protein